MNWCVTRRTVLALSASGLAGCGGEREDTTGDETGSPAATATGTANPALGDVPQSGSLRLTSPAFADGEPIPDRYGRAVENVNPPLEVSGVPPATESLVLVVDDPDAVDPAGKVWLHWLVWNVPPDLTTVPAGWEPERAVQGVNDFGNRGYDGPAPPDGRHTYRFKCYALEQRLDLPTSASKRRVGDAMRDARLAQTQLTGTYAP